MNELETAQLACVEAGKIAMGYFKRNPKVRKKGLIDLVTEADVECERKIKWVISKEYPHHSFLGEEEGSQGGAQGTGKEVWLIDPIDGTTNFFHGIEEFSHSVALVKNGKIVCGAVYNPVQKKLYSAAKGKGAFLNNRKIIVSKTQKLIDSVIVTGFPYEDNELRDKSLKSLGNLVGKCQGVRRFGSAALDFCRVAEGSCDGYFEYQLSPWDVAAGILIAKEAGGKVTTVNNETASPDSVHFVASNNLLHDELISHLERV